MQAFERHLSCPDSEHFFSLFYHFTSHGYPLPECFRQLLILSCERGYKLTPFRRQILFALSLLPLGGDRGDVFLLPGSLVTWLLGCIVLLWACRSLVSRLSVACQFNVSCLVILIIYVLIFPPIYYSYERSSACHLTCQKIKFFKTVNSCSHIPD